MAEEATPSGTGMTNKKPSIPTNYIAVLQETLKPYSVSSAELLAGTGIALKTLDDYFHQTELDMFIKLVEKAIGLTQDPALGLQFGRCMSLASHGMLGVAASNQVTVGEAMTVLRDYSQLRVTFYYFHTRVEGDNIHVEVELAPLPEPFSRFMIESFLGFVMSQLNGVDRQKRSDMPKVAISVTFNKSAWYSTYRKHLGAQVSFSQPCNSIRFPKSLLKTKLENTNTALAHLALQQCQDQLAAREQSYRVIVSNLIRAHRSKMVCREFVAKKLNISGSTLNRKLAKEGTNFTALAQEVRFQEACEYLLKTNKSINEIAHLLGYEDPSNLGRIFRQRTGSSASLYRKTHRPQ